MNTRFASLLLGFALIAAFMLVPSAAQADAVSPVAARCGDVLTGDAYLAEDLTCSGPGLTLNGSLTLDLRGHKLVGHAGAIAISVVGAHSSPVIRNGTVSSWADGVTAEKCFEGEGTTRTVRLMRVTFIKNVTAILAANGFEGSPSDCNATFSVRRSRFISNRVGIVGDYGGSVDVAQTVFKSNVAAVALSGSLHVRRSRFLNNEYAIDCTRCTVASSVFKSNRYGIIGAAEVTANKVIASEFGIVMRPGADSWITQFSITNNFILRNATGVSVTRGVGPIRSNVFSHNVIGYTTSNQGPDPDGWGWNVTLEDNRFRRNSDGVYTTETGTSLKDNRAFHNVRWGIFAPLAIDLGGNRARGNGQAPQCVGVVCAAAS